MGKLTTAMVLGIVGGVFGIISALIALMIGGIAAGFEAEGGSMVAGLGFAAVFIAVVGIVGGALAKSRPSWSAGLQLFACIAGFIAVSMAWLIAGPLLLLGAVFAFAGRHALVPE